MILPPLIWDEFHAAQVPPAAMDALWAHGWRHFGTQFFRYSLMEHEGTLQTVVPSRVELAHLVLSKSQRRVLRKNGDVALHVEPAELSDEARAMFQRHKTRFTQNVPEELSDFLSDNPSDVPCECLQLRCVLEGKCIAISFLDAGSDSVSSVYAVFEPEFASRSLGIFTMLQEMMWARSQGKKYAYPGYATLGRSHYDYKKQFSALQGYDWAGQRWMPWRELALPAS
jgi:arginyl-tRNA--protein-N-Asp/Glu arginylyltransferase